MTVENRGGAGLILAAAAVAQAAPKLPYDPTKDLAPITLVAAAPVPMTSAGPGTAPHLQTELLKQAVGGNVLPVQYKGSPAAMTGLLAREAKAAFVLVPVGLPHERAGKVKALAIDGPGTGDA